MNEHFLPVPGVETFTALDELRVRNRRLRAAIVVLAIIGVCGWACWWVNAFCFSPVL